MTFTKTRRFTDAVKTRCLTVTALVEKWGKAKSFTLRAPKAKPLPCSPTEEQLERARAAMDQIHGDSSLLGRKL